MSILAECPICKRRQGTKNRKCIKCGEDLLKQKRSGKIKYWIVNRVQGKQIWEPAGYNISEAQDADGKRKVQKRENPFFSIKNHKLTFQKLADWYLSQEKIKKKKYYKTLTYRINKWNQIFGNELIMSMKASILLNHQEKRLNENWAESTIDQELSAIQTMIQAAVDDDMLDANAIKPFRKVKKLIKGNSNARDKIITIEEFYRLLDTVPVYARGIVSLGFFTGMRKREILNLTWSKVFLQHEIPHIKLDKGDTKEGQAKIIPLATRIKGNPCDILKVIPRGLHDEHVFLFRGKPLFGIKNGLRRACEDIGLNYGRFKRGGFIFHDLRHCFATYMRRAGVDQLTIMQIMGHSPGKSFEMTSRYSSFNLDDLKIAIEKLEIYLAKVSVNVSKEKS